MTKNMLGVNPYVDQFMVTVLTSLRQTLLNTEDIDNIEIELKYAEFKKFGNYLLDERYLKDVKEAQMRDTILNAYDYQLIEFKKSVEILSRQAIISLNPLGKGIYQVGAGFNEFKHRRFYHIRELLLKMCKYNSENNYTARPLDAEGQHNIYHELSLNANNHLLKLKEENEMRLDLYIKDEAPESLRGRYSYSNRSGWKRTEKVPLCMQLDFMLNQRTFRFAINREIQTDVPADQIQAVADILRANPKLTDIRLKRILRVEKGNVCEYALSEIYNISERNNNNFPEIPLKIAAPAVELNAYLNRIFINFFSVHQRSNNNIKYEIESEFSRTMAKHFKRLLSRNNTKEVQLEIESAIEEMYAMFWAEHSTKVRQVPLLNSRVSEMPETRLENEFGNYMRSQLYDAMRNN